MTTLTLSHPRFAEQLQPLPSDLGERARTAQENLQAKGFVVMAGLTRYMAGAVSVMAGERHIVEMCPKEPTKRFATEESINEWLGKGGGRNVFLLLKQIGQDGVRLAGYGWTGAEPSSHVPDGKTTFAVRIGNEGRGNKAGADFSTLIVAGSAALHGTRGHWLETWGSNAAARDAYERIGFVYTTGPDGQIVTKQDTRPTLEPVGSIKNGREVFVLDGKPVVNDTRFYMQFPDEELLG